MIELPEFFLIPPYTIHLDIIYNGHESDINYRVLKYCAPKYFQYFATSPSVPRTWLLLVVRKWPQPIGVTVHFVGNSDALLQQYESEGRVAEN